MEALRFTGKTKKLEYVTLPIPKVTAPDEVLLKVAFSGVCGTDIHTIAGEFPCYEGTMTLGHEFSGTVVDVGSAVNKVKKGDRVSVDPMGSCRCCDFCHSGNPHYCKSGGIQTPIKHPRDGGWATYAIASMTAVTKLPDTITLEQGALAEPMSCLAHGWDLLNPVPIGSRILITGAGIIGNLWVCLLHLQGHKKVTVSEPILNRLNFVKNLETGYTLVTPEQLRSNQAADPNYLFDVVIDCSGYCPAIEHAMSLLDKGGKLCVFGVAAPHGKISVSPFELFAKELTIFAVNVNPFSFVKSMGFLESMGSRYLDYSKLGVQIFALKDYEKALEYLRTGLISKAIFKL